MIEESFFRDIEEQEHVDIEVEKKNKSCILINHYQVYENKRGDGIGSSVMNNIIEMCENEDDIDKIEMHIGLTWRGDDGFPVDKKIENDPTIRFLLKHDFNLIDYGADRTVLAKRSV